VAAIGTAYWLVTGERTRTRDERLCTWLREEARACAEAFE
jgi:hypothetical protein